jgi:hypothetical protein
MSFGSNGEDWCNRFEKNQLQVFSLNRGQTIPRGQVSHEFCRAKTKQRKHTKHEFWVKRGGFGAFVSKSSTASFFASTVARTALGGGFGTSFVDRNLNYENTPNMSFGSNGWIGCVRFQKINYKLFRSTSGQNVPRGGFRTRFVDRNRNCENSTKHEFWVKRGGLGAFVSKNSTASFFASQWPELPSGAGFARVLSTETKTAKTHQT